VGVIEVVDYDPTWPRRFEQLRREYADALAAAGVPVVAIEHVGSTAVPGLAAKPVIDCDIVVAEQNVPAAAEALIELGFAPLGDLGIPLRWAFKEPARLTGTNTYVVVDGCLSLRNHLAAETRCGRTRSFETSTPPSSDASVREPPTSTSTAAASTPSSSRSWPPPA
jgi:GrpB-like predicted nucleotidyltransferase (UPF0157 family)